MRLLLISAFRADPFLALCHCEKGVSGPIIMTVLNRRVSRCHWKSINTHPGAGAVSPSPSRLRADLSSQRFWLEKSNQLRFQ